MPLYITHQIVMFDRVLEEGDVLREGDIKEQALEAAGWGIVVDEEQLHWFEQAEDDDEQIAYLDQWRNIEDEPEPDADDGSNEKDED